MATWRELVGMDAVKPYTHSKVVALDAPDPALLYGVELEIENVPNWPDMVTPGLYQEEDGSLRNNGREFITKPMSYSVLSHVLRLFFSKNKLSADNYSERTSVHIHANCQDLTAEQIGTVCLLYQCFEPVLYRWIGDDRDKNIFCVPWTHSNLSYNMLHNFVEKKDTLAVRRWMKYSGLNLLPLYEQGTIEFRHMAGTCDVGRILDWAGMIGCLFAHARKVPLDVTKKWLIGLNTTSAYGVALESIFRQYAYNLRYPNYEADLEEGVLGVKYALMDTTTAKKKPSSSLAETIEQMRRMYEIRPDGTANAPSAWPAPRAGRATRTTNGAMNIGGTTTVNPFTARQQAEEPRIAPAVGRPITVIMDDIQQFADEWADPLDELERNAPRRDTPF